MSVALGVYRDDFVKRKATPEPDMNAISHRDQIVRVELGGTRASEIAGEQVGAKHVAVEVGGVVGGLRRLGQGGRLHGGRLLRALRLLGCRSC